MKENYVNHQRQARQFNNMIADRNPASVPAKMKEEYKEEMAKVLAQKEFNEKMGLEELEKYYDVVNGEIIFKNLGAMEFSGPNEDGCGGWAYRSLMFKGQKYTEATGYHKE
jgi:hypothetical protein